MNEEIITNKDEDTQEQLCTFYKFLLSFVLSSLFWVLMILYPYLVVLLIISTGYTFYFVYSLVVLEGFSRKVYYCKNIENIDKNTLGRSIDTAQFNIQILHSFLVMAIAFVALTLSLYNLYKSLYPSMPLPILQLISSFTGILVSIVGINFKWYKKYNKLMDIKLD